MILHTTTSQFVADKRDSKCDIDFPCDISFTAHGGMNLSDDAVSWVPARSDDAEAPDILQTLDGNDGTGASGGTLQTAPALAETMENVVTMMKEFVPFSHNIESIESVRSSSSNAPQRRMAASHSTKKVHPSSKYVHRSSLRKDILEIRSDALSRT